MSHVFFSYSRWDRQKQKLAFDKLLMGLRAAGIELWLAPENVPAGVDWKEAIGGALDEAGALIYVVTTGSGKRGMTRELGRALDRGIPVFPVVFEERHQDKIPASLHMLDAHVACMYRGYDGELERLIQALPASVRHAHAVAPPTPQSRGYVFISYAEEDTDFVLQLRGFLKEKGYGFWDYQDSDRNYQTQLFLELEEVIRGAAATVSVLSPDWKKSKWAAKEYLYSEEVSVPVFLVMARTMEPTLVIAGVPYIDFTTDLQRGFEKLDRELRRKGLL